MGLMDMLNGLLGGNKTPKTGHGVLDAFLPMLLKGGALGGLAGLIGKFTNAGLGAKANSWVGTGPNQAIAPHEVESALGAGAISDVAKSAGVSTEEAKSGLASLLPSLVNGLTPGGTLPTGNIAMSLKGLDFKSILGALGK